MNEEQVELVINSICSNDLNSIKEFVNANKDQIDSVTTFGTMLQIASREGKIDIAKYLINSGADVNIGGGFADSAMIDAVVQGHFDMVKLLLSHGAILDTSTFAANALFTAISGGYPDIAKYLIDQGIDLAAAYHIGKIENCDALEYARQYGQMEIYDYIKERLHKD